MPLAILLRYIWNVDLEEFCQMLICVGPKMGTVIVVWIKSTLMIINIAMVRNGAMCLGKQNCAGGSGRLNIKFRFNIIAWQVQIYCHGQGVLRFIVSLKPKS